MRSHIAFPLFFSFLLASLYECYCFHFSSRCHCIILNLLFFPSSAATIRNFQILTAFAWPTTSNLNRGMLNYATWRTPNCTTQQREDVNMHGCGKYWVFHTDSALNPQTHLLTFNDSNCTYDEDHIFVQINYYLIMNFSQRQNR